MAVPGHDAVGLDVELAQAELAALDHGGLLGEIGGDAHHVGDAPRAVGHHLLALAVGYALVRRASSRSLLSVEEMAPGLQSRKRPAAYT